MGYDPEKHDRLLSPCWRLRWVPNLSSGITFTQRTFFLDVFPSLKMPESDLAKFDGQWEC